MKNAHTHTHTFPANSSIFNEIAAVAFLFTFLNTVGFLFDH